MGVDTLESSPDKKRKEEWAWTLWNHHRTRKGRRNGRRNSGIITGQEREGGMGVDTLESSPGKKGKEEWA